MKNLSDKEQAVVIFSRSAVLVALFFVVVGGAFASALMSTQFGPSVDDALQKSNVVVSSPPIAEPISIPEDDSWKAPDENTIPSGKAGEQILYGRELVAHTAKYLGPKGSVAQIANIMNCQNCHNDAGTKAFALNFSAVESTYPQFKARSNSYVSIAQRINGCFERSLNGSKLDSNSKEMRAMIAYMKWLGKEVAKGLKPKKSGIMKLAYLDRAADPIKGKVVYLKNCMSCHGKNGQGVLAASGKETTYPPLWGRDSYNDGAGLFRISNFAGFVKNNMPFGVNYQHAKLSDEEAWDVAAYVNSQPRPHKDQKSDWKVIAKKPVDFPFGPYADNFSEQQHKYGPYKEIEKAQKKSK